MTITTDIRINHPVPAIELLDHVTRRIHVDDDVYDTTPLDRLIDCFEIIDPSTVSRWNVRAGEKRWEWSSEVASRNSSFNNAGQGLWTLAAVEWGEEPDTGDPDCPEPPALVVLSIDNPYGLGPDRHNGVWHQANLILPVIRDWLDAHDVPRTSWWWEDESYGVFYPGTLDVTNLMCRASISATLTWRPS